MCYQLANFAFDECENICIWSYHHQIGNMNRMAIFMIYELGRISRWRDCVYKMRQRLIFGRFCKTCTFCMFMHHFQVLCEWHSDSYANYVIKLNRRTIIHEQKDETEEYHMEIYLFYISNQIMVLYLRYLLKSNYQHIFCVYLYQIDMTYIQRTLLVMHMGSHNVYQDLTYRPRYHHNILPIEECMQLLKCRVLFIC